MNSDNSTKVKLTDLSDVNEMVAVLEENNVSLWFYITDLLAVGQNLLPERIDLQDTIIATADVNGISVNVELDFNTKEDTYDVRVPKLNKVIQRKTKTTDSIRLTEELLYSSSEYIEAIRVFNEVIMKYKRVALVLQVLESREQGIINTEQLILENIRIEFDTITDLNEAKQFFKDHSFTNTDLFG